MFAGLAYAALAGGLFLALFARPGSDDYAGWSLVVAALGLPPFLVVALARDRLGRGSAAALGLPASLSLVCVTLLMLVPISMLTRSDLVAVAGVFVLAPGSLLVTSVVLVRRLVGMPVRVAARRVLAVVGLAGAAASLAGVPLWWGFWDVRPAALGLDVAAFLLGVLPLGWALGPALALLATRDDPA